jgi:hypothetical protein
MPVIRVGGIKRLPAPHPARTKEQEHGRDPNNASEISKDKGVRQWLAGDSEDQVENGQNGEVDEDDFGEGRVHLSIIAPATAINRLLGPHGVNKQTVICASGAKSARGQQLWR